MRIAHITATFPPYQAGTGNVCYHNARELARRGHQVHVYTAAYGDAPALEERNGITIHRLNSLFRFGNAPFLPGLLGLSDFDIIHLQHPFIFGAELIWLVSKIRKIPYILTHHNDLIGDGFRRFLFDAYTGLVTRLVFKGSAKFAVVSRDHAAHCRLSQLFLDRWEDVVEVPNGVDTELFQPGVDGTAIRQRYGIPDDAQVILFVGNLDRAHHFKGMDFLLDFFSHYEDPNYLLLIVGDGDQKGRYEEIARTSGLSERVIFTGAVPNHDLPPYYNAADISILPSFPPESFGIVLIESLACGTPVIASDLPGVRSVVSDGRDGFLISPGSTSDLADKLGLFQNFHQDKRQAMGQAGRAKVVEHYSWDGIGRQLESIYQTVLGTSLEPRPVDPQVEL